ncbi:Trypsin-1 [Eumeta japonica]|uniref:Trypsin-1 n=1 Tax=Eumeta variegata TaxID=151549 RepID=A0A4C1ZTR5_EUMVA|nr:Trypsin-1 [Eumeta japonica]
MAAWLGFLSFSVLAFGFYVADAAPKKSYVGVVGGEPVPIEEFPYQVSVRIMDQHVCGGTIIHEQFILTAAHCSITGPSMYSIRVGTANLEEGGKSYDVESIIDHHLYDHSGDYDLSIMKLKDKLELSDKVAIAKLSTMKKRFSKGTVFNITGWGDTQPGPQNSNCLILMYPSGQRSNRWGLPYTASVLHSLCHSKTNHRFRVKNSVDIRAHDYSGAISTVLLLSEVPLVDQKTCENDYEGITDVNSHMFCAGADGHDACQGDSGGPLSLNGEVVGVVSRGKYCARKEYPTIYTKVSKFQGWIKKIINRNL